MTHMIVNIPDVHAEEVANYLRGDGGAPRHVLEDMARQIERQFYPSEIDPDQMLLWAGDLP